MYVQIARSHRMEFQDDFSIPTIRSYFLQQNPDCLTKFSHGNEIEHGFERVVEGRENVQNIQPFSIQIIWLVLEGEFGS